LLVWDKIILSVICLSLYGLAGISEGLFVILVARISEKVQHFLRGSKTDYFKVQVYGCFFELKGF